MSLPMIKVVNGPSPTKTAVSETTVLGMSSAVSALSQAVDLIPHDEEELLYFLRFRHAISEKAADRSRWFLGRIYNRLSGEDPNYIELSGTHLKQTLAVSEIDIHPMIANAGEYQLRLDIVSKAINTLKAKAKPQ